MIALIDQLRGAIHAGCRTEPDGVCVLLDQAANRIENQDDYINSQWDEIIRLQEEIKSLKFSVTCLVDSWGA